jgi:hypothetical protein
MMTCKLILNPSPFFDMQLQAYDINLQWCGDFQSTFNFTKYIAFLFKDFETWEVNIVCGIWEEKL